jgi:putative endonuclease
MYYVYILKSKRVNRLYKGFTKDLRRRIVEHNSGEVRSTKSYAPWELVYYQGFIDKTDARREELFLKTGKGKERIKYLLEETLKSKLKHTDY